MMSRTVRLVALTLVVLSFAASSSAFIPPERSNHCPPDPDSGWIVCSARCAYPNTCVGLNPPQVGPYCWQAALVSGYPAHVCHEGDYDPCCDPNYQW